MKRKPRDASLREAMSLRASIAMVAIVLAGYALAVGFAFRRGGVSGLVILVLAAPLIAFLLARPLIALFPAYFGWVTGRVWSPWQGRYYAFDDHQIRIVEARGRLWFSTVDVHAALAVERRPALLAQFVATERRRDGEIGDVLSNAGLARLFARSTEPRVLRFLQWAERDVRKPWQNKRDAAESAIVQNPGA